MPNSKIKTQIYLGFSFGHIPAYRPIIICIGSDSPEKVGTVGANAHRQILWLANKSRGMCTNHKIFVLPAMM